MDLNILLITIKEKLIMAKGLDKKKDVKKPKKSIKEKKAAKKEKRNK